MAIRLPELAKINYTSLDFNSIIDTVSKIISENPSYFVDIDDFLASNASRMTIELVSYVVELLAARLDWMANELFLPTATQKESIMNLLKLINYRLSLPKTAAVNVTAKISTWVEPFVFSARYTIPAKDLNGGTTTFEMLMKDEDGKYIYEGVGSNYEFDTGTQIVPVLRKDDLIFYQGTSHVQFFTMSGKDNEYVLLSKTNVEEGSIRAWKVTRDGNGNIIAKKELVEVVSFISPEAQNTTVPPFKVQNTSSDGAMLMWGEKSVVEIFAQNDEVMVWYRVTGGSIGNITKQSINYVTNMLASGKSIQATFVNYTAGSGGEESETMEHARRTAPLTLSTANKTVGPTDFKILLQNLENLMNSMTYGKSNEPTAIYTDYGYHIPPFETWIYPIFSKIGWESFPTYSYNTTMKIERPYTKYGPLEVEKITFLSTSSTIELTKINKYSYNNIYTNIKVTDLLNTTSYSPGGDFVIDLEARTIIRIFGGSIGETDTVLVQYFENEYMGVETTINFASSDTQDVIQIPIYPNERTWAFSSDMNTVYEENTVSVKDFNFPTGDYYIDYRNSKIIRNSPWPYLVSYSSYGNTNILKNGINNEFIISFDGLNIESYNADNDFPIDAFGSWVTVGGGSDIPYSNTTYYFKVSVDNSEFVEYSITTGGTGTWKTWQLADIINTTISGSGAICFAWPDETASNYIITFMSLTGGSSANIDIDNGTTGTSLFSLVGIDISSKVQGIGEEINLIELAKRCRFTLNSLSLCYGYSGQSLPLGNEEKPEIFSKSNLTNLSSFNFGSGTADTIILNLLGTNGAGYDGDNTIIFTTTIANGPYDLNTYQGRIDLIRNMQTDIDNSIGDQDIVQVFWLRIKGNFYRIGFRQIDTASTTISPVLTIKDPVSNTARKLLQMVNNQSSADSNLVISKVSPNSDMDQNYLLEIRLLGAMGKTALIQSKANNALHNNTLSFLKFGDNQYKYGTNILSNTIIGEKSLINDGYDTYIISGSGPTQNNKFTLTITSPPSGFSDGDYEVTIPATTYNIVSLISAINLALKTADMSGTAKDISEFIKCEKVENQFKIRFTMIDFDSTLTNPPDVSINNNVSSTINKLCIDKLGFYINQKMSYFSTIYLHYCGDWQSNFEEDTSEEASIKRHLEDNRLICQDYIIKDALLTSFDVKGTIYCSKGFDRAVIKSNVETKVRENLTLDKREFGDKAVLSYISKIIHEVEGVEYINMTYFGKDYQSYEKYINTSKAATITGYESADYIVARWSPISSFKITIDGCTVSGINYDGSYIITVGNTWNDRSYTDLLDHLYNGDSGTNTGGLAHAIPLEMGKSETDLREALNITQSSGIFKFTSVNEGGKVLIKIEDPENLFTYGYQTVSRTSDVLESEYTPSSTYSIKISIDGGSLTNYSITSPASGLWSLSTIASQIKLAIPVTATCGIDLNGKIRITSLSGGNQSTIDIDDGTVGTNLLTIIGPSDTPVDGVSGYISCLGEVDGSLGIIEQESYGLDSIPDLTTRESYYNYVSEIPAKYNEVLYLSDDYYNGDINVKDNQKHGLIFIYEELKSQG